MRIRLITIIVIILLTSCVKEEPTVSQASGGLSAGGLSADKAASLSDVQIGDEFNIQITVHGFDDRVPEFIPFDAVLLIDKSGSMSGDPFHRAKNAALRFVELAENSGADIRIAVVTFGENAQIINNLLNVADPNYYNTIISNIEALPDASDDETHIDDAMETANNILTNGTSATRIAILLTDGRPEPNEAAQVNEITDTHITEAQLKSFRYYTIGIGNYIDVALLQLIATNTNGDFELATTAEQLNNIYENLFDEIVHTIVTGQIILEEKVNTDYLEIIPGTLEVDEALPMPNTSDLNNFYSTGEINIPMGELRSNQLHTIYFRVRTKSCLPVDSPEDFTTIPANRSNSQVTYVIGTVPSAYLLPAVELKCWKDPGLYIKKDFQVSTKTVTLTLKNSYLPMTGEDMTIRDISIHEVPSIHYQYKVNTASPELDAFIPGGITDLLYWHIDGLQPQEERSFSFEVEQRAYTPRDSNPLRVDADKEPDNADATVHYVLPGGIKRNKKLPQKQVTAYLLDYIPDGRPDLGIAPPLSGTELYTLGLGPYDPASDPNMPSDGPAAGSNWPQLDNFLMRWDSEHIYVDSRADNGYVQDWSRDEAAHVQSHIHHVTVDALHPEYWSHIEGQGDLFYRSDENRIYVKIFNAGLGTANPIDDGISLYIKNYVTDAWDLLATNNIPAIPSHGDELIYFQLPASILIDDHLQQFGPATWNVWISEFRVEITVNPNEKHTNNNISYEKIFVVD